MRSPLRLWTLALLFCAPLGFLQAQQALSFTGVNRLTNGELALTLEAPTGASYRIETAPTISNWVPLVTFPTNTTATLQHTDSAAPMNDSRLYRALQLTNANALAGDHLQTSEGDVIIQPRNHASFVMGWQGKIICVDPADAASFTGLPKADLVLITHAHSDHFSVAKIDSVRTTNATLVVPQAVYSGLNSVQKSLAVVLGYGKSTNVLGLSVEAVPATNSNHPPGTGNGYILTVGGKRIYISGDTGNIVELRQLPNIDVAFLCINQPYTMTVNDATNLVTAFKPKIVYPYHYRDQSGSTANAATFKQRLDPRLGIEVRLRQWY